MEKEYITRTIKIWLENTEDNYLYFHELAAEALDQADGDKDAAAEILADEIKEAVSNAKPTNGGSLYDDILTNALAEADYVEIANSFLDE